MAVKPIPDGYHTVTPYLVVEGAAQLMDFMKQTFQATEVERMTGPDGAIMHAEVKIGDSMVMVGEAMGGDQQPLPGMIYLYVEDADTTYQRALRAGATLTMEIADQFWGDRAGGVKDPTGIHWWIATHKEDLSSEEIAKRAEDFMKQQAES